MGGSWAAPLHGPRLRFQADAMRLGASMFISPIDCVMEWLKALGVAGFLFFLVKGLLWLVVFYLISRGIIQKSAVEQAKLRLRRLFRFQRP